MISALDGTGKAMLLDSTSSFLLVVDMQQRLLPVIADAQPVIDTCRIMLQAGSVAGVPALVTEQYPKGLGHTVPELLAGDDPVTVREKVEFSCAQNEGVMAVLAQSGRQQIVLCGVEAHICVLQTALDLRQRAFEVFVVADAVGSRRPESKAIAMDRLRGSGVHVVTAEMVLFEWAQTAASPLFKPLSKLIR